MFPYWKGTNGTSIPSQKLVFELCTAVDGPSSLLQKSYFDKAIYILISQNTVHFPPHQNVAEAQRRQGCFSMLFMCFFLHVELQSFNLTAKINCAHTQWLSEVLFSLGSYFHHRIRLCFWHSAAWGPGNHNQLIGFLASYNETSLITWIF